MDDCAPHTSDHWVALDLETTGLDHRTDRIVEIGAVRFDTQGREADRFETLVNPRRPVSRGAFLVHRLDDATLALAPPAADVLRRFLAWLHAGPARGLIAHNGRFDAAFLGAEIARNGLAPPPHLVFDTLDLARRHLPGMPDHRLETLAARLGLDPDQPHRALADCLRVKALWLLLQGPDRLPLSFRVEHHEDDDARAPAGWERLAHAAAARWTVRITYHGGSRGPAPREITPVRFLHRGGFTYVVALCHCDHHEKQFRLDRILSYELILPAGPPAAP